jgi:aminopeptidase N
MKTLFLSLLTLLLIFTTSCSKKTSITNKPSDPIVREPIKGLSEKSAKERNLAISDINYLFEIDLRTASKSESFTGKSSVVFNFKKESFPSEDLTLDFEGGDVLDVLINGKKASFEYNSFFISIKKSLLETGKNTIKVTYSKKYSLTGSGLYKFTDSTDGNTYVYTDFEPYDANLFAPMFDQPNLKASYSLNVQAPKSWTVISSVREQLVTEEGSSKMWSFPKSQKFSTYIFSLHGGPYAVWSDKVKLKSKEIELRLFARKSLSKFVKPDFWFKISKQGFNFFEQYFSTEYPYTKYDQVLVPDFNSGAMENVAAVTFNEAYISRENTAPRSQRRKLASVIFHEMAHMWFGNLVTMNWWNDLWLNESFATFMATTGLYYNTEYTEIWTVFNTRRKQWAYSEDRWRTTHPIEADIPSTSEATANFDGITYGKGAAVLKQLVFLIGEENFKKGLADYFKTYAEKNTLRENFIDSLQAYTDENLKSWTSEWLQTKGLNSLDTKINCENSVLKSIDFTQGVVSGQESLRTHKIKLALWLSSNPKSPDVTEEFKISGKNTSWTPKKEMPCPKAVFPNWEDHAYIQIHLDQKSLNYFSKNIDQVESSLMKAQFWSIIGTMLTLGEFKPEKVMPLIKKHLPKETDADSVNTILKLSVNSQRSGLPTTSVFRYYSNRNKALADQTELSNLLKSLVVKAAKTDVKKELFDNWLYHTYDIAPNDLNMCLDKGCTFDPGFEIDLDRKWIIVQLLAAAKDKSARAQIKNLSKLDDSRRGELFTATAEASLSENKSALLAKALNASENFSLKKRNAILSGLAPDFQKNENYNFLISSFYSQIGNISKLPTRVQTTFADQFQPLFCGEFESKKILTEKMIDDSNWNFSVKKTLYQSLDNEERCLKIKKLSQGANI